MLKKLSATVIFFLIFFGFSKAQDYGQVYVYLTTNFSTDGSLQSSYLPLMGVATEDTSVTPPAVTAYTACTVCPYYKLKSGELGNASIDIGIAGLENGAMTLIASGSGSDLGTVIENLGTVSASGAGQLLFVFPKGSDMTTPTSTHDNFNASNVGGVTAVTNADGYWWGIEGTRMHSITLDSPHLGYSEWYVIGRTTWTAIGSKIKLRLLDATDDSDMPPNNLPKITISEVMYNSSGTDDEWIEIYNGSGADVDISNWTIGMNASGNSEYSGDIFTFPNSTTITAGDYITVALGSNGDGIFNNDNPFTPDFNNLSMPDFLVADTNDTDNLANNGGFVVLRPDDFDTVSIVHYDHSISGTNGSGYTYENKAPDFNNQVGTSDNSTWQSSFITGGSPKIKAAEIWDDTLGSSDNLTILDKENIFVAVQDGNINDITINSGGFLSILRNSSSSLTVANNFTNNGTVTLYSDPNEFASIIVGGTASGNIVYKRYVNTVGTNEWDLIGSPVDGLSISSFASTNDTPLAIGGGSGSNQYAIGYYDNSSDDWTNYTTATIGGAGNFDIGKGYQMATDSGATMTFTGTIATSDQTQSIINNHGNGSGKRWNLVANPYPSYLNANTNAHGINNLLSVNSSVIDSNYLAIYGYDADGSGYTIYNNTSGATYIAPGQGFMVAASSSSAADLSFTEAMQTTSGGDDFISGDVMENTEVVVKLFNGDNELDSTKLFFDEGLTLGLDPGYDAGHFDDNAPLTTRLIDEDEGYGMAINAMGLDAMENAVIPLVINQSAGQEFRINLHTATIPDPNVYLEDVEEGTFTNLYEGDFVYTPTSDLSGAGRFFIHMSADTMSNAEVSTSMLNAYKEIDASYITIEGLATQSNETKVSLYNILGREVLSTTLNNNMGTQTISTVGLSAGIYVIELESGSDRLTKKLLIQ